MSIRFEAFEKGIYVGVISIRRDEVERYESAGFRLKEVLNCK